MEYEQGKLFDGTARWYDEPEPAVPAETPPETASVAGVEVVKKLVLCDPPEHGYRYE